MGVGDRAVTPSLGTGAVAPAGLAGEAFGDGFGDGAPETSLGLGASGALEDGAARGVGPADVEPESRGCGISAAATTKAMANTATSNGRFTVSPHPQRKLRPTLHRRGYRTGGTDQRSQQRARVAH